MAKDFPGWCSRVTRVLRSDFVPLARLAALPAALTAAYLWAISLAYLGPEKIRERVEAASAAAGQQISNEAAVAMVTARYLPIMAVFGLLIVLAIPLVQSAGLFTVIRRANREFAPVDAAVRFALPRLARLIGWSLLTGVLMVAVAMATLLPGIVGQSRPLFNAGAAVGGVLVVAIGGSLLSALLGVVLVEGKGLRRCFELLRGRWLATSLRMLVFGAIYWGYQQVSEWLLAGLVGLVGTGLIPGLVMSLLTIPALVFQIVVSVVTYAELRGREDGTGTGGLAAGLVDRRSGPVDSMSFGGPAAAGIVVAPRRRWVGFRWMTPVLVLAVLLGAGGPVWPGAVVPVAAVSPVPAGVDGTGGDSSGDSSGGSSGESGDGSGSTASVSGSSGSNSDSSGSNGGDAPKPDVSKSDSKPSGEDGSTSGEGAEVSSGGDKPRPESGATGGSNPAPEVADTGATKGAQQGSELGASSAATGAEPGAGQPDPAVAGSGGVKGAQQGGEVGVAATPPAAATGAQEGAQLGVTAATPPGADPNNAAVAAGAPGAKPVGPAETAADTEAKVICTGAACVIVPSRSASEAAAREAADPNAVKTAPPTGMEGAHLALDMVGMTQNQVGSGADVLNGIAYAAEGDWSNAVISVASAVPFVGDASKGARELKSAEALKALRAERDAKMTPELRNNLEDRIAQLEREGKVVSPQGPARPNTGPDEPPPGAAKSPDASKSRADLEPVGDFANEAKAFEHYSKHVKGTELGPNGYAKAANPKRNPDMPEYKNFAEYRTAARGFMGGARKDGVLEGVKKNGDLARFDPRTGEFGLRSPEGVIRTFFRPTKPDVPDYGMKYFRSQFEPGAGQ